MADLIIRGMKMPENCAVCQFWDSCSLIAKAGFEDWVSVDDAVQDGNLVRLENCPLLPLPAGHGRLIDADDLIDEMGLAWDYDQITNAEWTGIREWLNFAPTIVPAEGSVNDGT